MSDQERPLWPYAVGLVGNLVFGVGAFLLYVTLQSRDPGTTGERALEALAIGGAILGVGWIGALKYGQGGFGAISGSFAVTAALFYAYLHRNDWSMFQATGTMIMLSFAWFTLGHIFARGLRITKYAAGAALVGVLGEIYESVAQTKLDHTTEQMISLLTCLGLAATVVACAFEMMSLRRGSTSDLE